MIYPPRAYRDERDLAEMWRVLQDGRRSGGPTYYVHIGDLNWWLFYLDQDQDPRQRIYLWDRRRAGAEGWALFSPRFRAFDVFVHPEESAHLEAMWLWAEEQMAGLVRAQGGHDLCTMWISEHDTRLCAHLESRGFEQTAYHLHYLTRSLEESLAEIRLLPGYAVRHVAGEQEVRRRAVLGEGLRRMQAYGMATAGVCVEHDNCAASALYESLGFRLAQDIHTYRKAI
jgi:hypothetical protein